MTRLRRAFESLTIIAFAAALTAPGVAGIFGRADSVTRENRTPVPAPAFAWDAAVLHGFPEAADAFLGDRLGFRHLLIRWHNVVELIWLGVSPKPTILPGKDGWIFYVGDYTLPIARGLWPLSKLELQRWRCVLEARRDWLAARGVPYVFVIAPDKHTVYPDLLPDYARRVGPRTRYEQLYEYMAEHSDVTLVDLRPALASARRDRLVYYPVGTHWNAIGARVAYATLIDVVRRWFPELTPPPSDAGSFVDSEDPGDTMAPGLHLDGLLQQPVPTLRMVAPPRWRALPSRWRVRRTTEQPGSSAPRALVFHDSFAFPWMADLSNDFSRVDYVQLRDFDFMAVAAAHPDIVIHEMVERFLAYEPLNIQVEDAWDRTWTGSAPGVMAPRTVGDSVAALCR